MENEVKEVLEEELTNESVKTNRKNSKVMIFGVVALAGALLFKFRNKINAKVEGLMIKSLTKKGYVISTQAPEEFEVISENLIKSFEE